MIHLVMVFRRRFRSSMRPVNRIKHVVDGQLATTAGTQANVVLAQATDTPLQSTSNLVETGCTINGIFLKVEMNATSSAALSNGYMYVFKNPGGNLVAPNANVVGVDDNKRYVIHQEMVMFQQQDGSNPRTVFVGVIAIPKGYRRFGPNDNLVVFLFSPGVNIQACVQCHYKEFR